MIMWITGATVVAKAELAKLPLLGTILSALECVFVKRTSAAGRKEAKDHIIKRAQDDRYPPILIFPSGTTHNHKSIISFANGAFIPGMPVTPTVMLYKTRSFDPAMLEGMVRTLYHNLCQIISFARIQLLEVYDPSEEEKKNPQLFNDNVRKIMIEKMKKTFPDVLVTPHSYADVRLQLASRGKGQLSADMVMSSVYKHLKMRTKTVTQLLDVFHSIDADGDGYISFQEFCTAMKFSDESRRGRQLFSVIDTDKNGQVGLNEFLVAVNALHPEAEADDCLTIFYHVCVPASGELATPEAFGGLLQRLEALEEDKFADALRPFAVIFEDGPISWEDFRKKATPNLASIRTVLQQIFIHRLGVSQIAYLEWTGWKPETGETV